MSERDEASTPKKDPSIHASVARNSGQRGEMSNRVSLVGNYVDPGRHKGRVTKRGREMEREGSRGCAEWQSRERGKRMNEICLRSFELLLEEERKREEEEAIFSPVGGSDEGWKTGRKSGGKGKEGEEARADRVALRTLLWKLRMWFRFPREQVSYSHSTLSTFPPFLRGVLLSPCLCGPPFFTQHSRVDAANCKLISPLHFLGIIVLVSFDFHIFRVTKRVELPRENVNWVTKENSFRRYSSNNDRETRTDHTHD